MVNSNKNISYIPKAREIGDGKTIDFTVNDFSTNNQDLLKNAIGSFTVTEVLSINDIGVLNNG